MAKPRRAKKRQLALAITASLAINAALLTGLAWRAHYVARLSQVQTVDLYLPPLEHQRPRTPKPPPTEKPPPIPPPVEAPPATLTGVPVTVRETAAPAPDGVATLPPEVASAPPAPLMLGCLGQPQSARGGARPKGCIDQAGRDVFEMVNRPGPPDPKAQNYAVLAPPGVAPESPVPGVKFTAGALPPSPLGGERNEVSFGVGVHFGYAADDKHFLPGQGSSIKYVFKPDEIRASDIPRPP
jgi:hypothetical protein